MSSQSKRIWICIAIKTQIFAQFAVKTFSKTHDVENAQIIDGFVLKVYIVTNVSRNFRIRYFQKRICNVENLEIIDAIVMFPCESVKRYRIKFEQQRTTKASCWNPRMSNRVR